MGKRCTLIVLDEADRMFEMGFEFQMKSILQNIRPGRQTLMFIATMKKKIEGFAREILINPVRITVGSIGQANTDVNQSVHVLSNEMEKWPWLVGRLPQFLQQGKIVVFVGAKVATEELGKNLGIFLASLKGPSGT